MSDDQLSDHKRLAQIREMPQGADEKFLLRLIWEYEQAMRAAHQELFVDVGETNHSLEMHALKARCILRDALADKIEHSDVEKHRAALREAEREADRKIFRDIATSYGPRREI